MMIKKMQIGLFVMPKGSTALKLFFFFPSDKSEKNAFSVSLGHIKNITCESLITSCSKIAPKFSFIPRGGRGAGGLVQTHCLRCLRLIHLTSTLAGLGKLLLNMTYSLRQRAS